MKNFILLFTLILMVGLNVSTVFATGEDFETNKSEYLAMCSVSDLTEEEEATCEEFQIYMSSQSSELQQKKADIDAQMKDIAANIAQEAAKIKQYEEQIAKLNIQIEELDNKIAELSIQIDAKKIEIEENELEVEVLQSKVKDRMVASQPTMRLNIMIDFLMGADNFEDFIRRANGLKAITDYEEEIRVELKDLLIKLEDDKVQLASNQVSLEVDKADLVDKQNSVLATQYKAKLVREEFYRQEVELEEQSNQIAGDLEALQKMQKELAIKLGKVVSSSGFMRPITAGRISAGTWHYPSSFGGGIHLGVDYADSKGTPVYAPANGVIVNSVDGCKDGWLGNSCGGDGGVNMGGNQIYMVVSVDGKTYGLRFFHFLIGSPIATGTIVSQGDKIAETGTSGNSTGCHTHIEVIYLGTMTVAEYVADWNGSLSFNASWGSDAYYNRLCENGASAPCRIKPESVFE